MSTVSKVIPKTERKPLEVDEEGAVNETEQKNNNASFEIHPETFRISGYISFWLMTLMAIFLTTYYVDQNLSEGPLITKYGYNNICVYFDFHPSKEFCAMVYPLVEYSLLFYVILSHLHVISSWQSGLISLRYLHIDRVLLVFEIFFMSLFRMIFVVDAVDNVGRHSAAFISLQLMLCIVAVKNAVYFQILHKTPLNMVLIWMNKPNLFSEKTKLCIHWGYVISLLLATIGKITFTISILADHPIVEPHSSQGKLFGQTVDMIWMLLASIIPLFIAIIQRKQIDNVFVRIAFVNLKQTE